MGVGGTGVGEGVGVGVGVGTVVGVGGSWVTRAGKGVAVAAMGVGVRVGKDVGVGARVGEGVDVAVGKGIKVTVAVGLLQARNAVRRSAPMKAETRRPPGLLRELNILTMTRKTPACSQGAPGISPVISAPAGEFHKLRIASR